MIQFYIRRIRRIFPALLTVIISCLIIGWFTLFENEFKQLANHTAASAAFITNIVLIFEDGYFDDVSATKPLNHLWSLGIEEQFYLIWPLVLLSLFRRTRKIFYVCIAILLSSFAFNVYAVYEDSAQAFFSPLSRFWELLIGTIVAFLMLEKGDEYVSGQSKNILSICGAIFLCAGFLLIHEGRLFPGYWALLPTIGTALIIMAGPSAWINSKILANPIFVWIGLISYPLYLWHWPILSFLRIYEGTFREISFEKRIFAVTLSIMLAWLTYKYIEQPLRFGKNKTLVTTVLTGAMILVGTLALLAYIKDGYPNRIEFLPKEAYVLFKMYPHPQRNLNCDGVYPELNKSWACLLSKPTPADVAIVGDSHANQYYNSFAKALDHKSVLNLSEPSCLPFVSENFLKPNWSENILKPKWPGNFLKHNCKKKQLAALDFLSKHQSIQTIYLTGYFSYLSAGGFKYGNIEGLREAQALDAEQSKTFIINGKDFIQTLIDSGKDVVIIKDIPDAIFKPINCVKFKNNYLKYIRAMGVVDGQESSTECAIDKKIYEKRNQPYEDALEKIIDHFPNIRILDPHPALCNNDICYIIKDSIPIYWNSDHLTVEGADMITKSFFSE